MGFRMWGLKSCRMSIRLRRRRGIRRTSIKVKMLLRIHSWSISFWMSARRIASSKFKCLKKLTYLIRLVEMRSSPGQKKQILQLTFLFNISIGHLVGPASQWRSLAKLSMLRRSARRMEPLLRDTTTLNVPLHLSNKILYLGTSATKASLN